MVRLFLNKIWEFFKPHIVPIALVAGIYFGGKYFLSSLMQHQSDDFSERIQKIQSIHDAEMKKIIDAETTLRAQHEKNLSDLKEQLDASIKKHEEALKELEDNKKKEIERLTKTYENDPDGLARELSRVTGLKVYVPQEKK